MKRVTTLNISLTVCTQEAYSPSLAFSSVLYHYGPLWMASQMLTLLSGRPPLQFPRKPRYLLTACEFFFIRNKDCKKRKCVHIIGECMHFGPLERKCTVPSIHFLNAIP